MDDKVLTVIPNFSLFLKTVVVWGNHVEFSDWRYLKKIQPKHPLSLAEVEYVMQGGKDSANVAEIIVIAKAVCQVMGVVCPIINNL